MAFGGADSSRRAWTWESNSNMHGCFQFKCYHKHESETKRVYEQRIQEKENSLFTPLVFSATIGMCRQASDHCLQMTCCDVSWEMGPILWVNAELVVLQNLFLSVEICHSVYSRSTLIHGQLHEGAAAGGLGHFWMKTLYCFVFMFLFYIFLSFQHVHI